MSDVLAFMKTLSRDQLTAEQHEMLQNLSASSPMQAEQLDFDSVVTPQPTGSFFNASKGMPTADEVRVLSVLMLMHFETEREDNYTVEKWVLDVESDAERITDLGDMWYPKSAGVWNPKVNPGILSELEHAIRVDIIASGGYGEIETAAAVLGNVSVSEISTYLKRLGKKKSGKLQGPVRGKSTSTRQVVAIPALARLLGSTERRSLRSAITKHRVYAEADARRTKAELMEDIEVQKTELKELHVSEVNSLNKTVAELKDEVTGLKAKVATEQKGKSKAQTSFRKLDATQRGNAKRVRDEERGKAKVEMATIRATAKEAAKAIVETEMKNVKKLKAAAHARAREWKARAENAEHAAAMRMVKIKALEGEMRDESEEMEEMEEMATDDVAKKHTEAFARLQAMPTWNLVRHKGTGRGGMQFEDIYTETIFEMFGNGTPISATGKNIVAVLRRAAPWLKVRKVSERTLNDKRFELRTAEETLAAIEVAWADAIRMLGFDETTKFGNASITSNVIIEKEGKLKAVILRGAYCSGGGTSEKIAAAIEQKCFARLRNLLGKLKAEFEKLYPGEIYPGPDPRMLSMGRLAGGGALMSDTCNGAEKAKALLADFIAKEMREVMGEEAWGKLSEEEQRHLTRVHKLDCWQHMRNIFLKAMSAAMSKLVEEELQPQLDTFASWERMSTDFGDLLRGSEKEFHHHCRYYNGKGREYSYHLTTNHPTAFVIHFERADGGRQDLDYDAAIPMYVNRKFMVEFLHSLIFSGNHSNVLEDFLYITYTTVQYIAMIRANAIMDLLVSRPLRWLTGKAHELDSFSPVTLLTIKEGKSLHRAPIDLVEELFQKGEADGSTLLQWASNDIFKPIADVQPLFAEYRRYTYEKETVLAPDGKTQHLIYQKAREDLFNPTDPTNQKTRQKTIEYLEAQCTAALKKMHDKKLAISKHLVSQEGASSFVHAERMHLDTIGLDGCNDRLAESVFGRLDMILRRFPGISLEAASGLAHALSTGNFEEGGFFYSLPPKLRHAILEMSRKTLKEMRKVDAADHVELNEYHVLRRKTNSQEELEALIKEYAFALSFFDRWQERGVKDANAMRIALCAFESHTTVVATQGAAEKERKVNQLRLDYLREQIEMRVRGLGFVEFRSRMAWSSGKDEEVGTVSELTTLLEDILMEERELDCCDELPTAAVVPIMKRKTLKALGEPTPQGQELAETIQDFDAEELLELAMKQRKALEVAGEIDEVADQQPEDPPSRCDESILGLWLEICWRYWRPATEAEKAKGEKRTKIAVKIWCEGEVVAIANGTSDTASARHKNVLAKGALRIRFPEDVERKEKEHYVWHMFQDNDWYGKTRKEAHLSWRYAESTLRKLAERQEGVGGAPRAPKQRK